MVKPSAIWSLVSMGTIFTIPFLHMFTKMMVAYVDVLGAKAKLGKPCQFEGT